MKKILYSSCVCFLSAFSSQLAAQTLIYNDFGAGADTGPAFQGINNDQVGNNGSADPATGVVTTGGATANTAVGLNNSSSVSLGSATSFTVDFVVSGFAGDAANISANGLFFGIVTGTDATGTGGTSLFNNNPGAIGIHMLNDNAFYGAGVNFIQDPEGGNNTQISDTSLAADPTTASLADGFTLSFTVYDDDTWSATSTGLSSDFTTVTGSLVAGNGRPLFADFVSGGIGINASIQGNDTAAVGFTLDEVTLTAIPEPSAFGLLAGCLAFGSVMLRCRG